MLFEKLLTTGATTQTKQLYAWGDNNSGELGDNTEVNKSSPVAIGNQSWLNVAGGKSFTLAVKSDRTLWSWGNNQYGQLGNGTVTQSFLLPSSFPSGLSWNTIATSTSHSVGIKSDGSLWAWGDNTYGELGNLSSISTNSPILVSGPTGVSWSAVSSNTGYETNFALTTTGLLYAWGYNLGGQLGVNSFNTNMSSPVLVPGPPVTKTWKTVSVMQGTESSATAPNVYVTVGIQTDGTLWSWGTQSSFGELGINTVATLSISSPVLVSGPAGVSWTAVSAGGGHVLAITTDGILYAWGWNATGQLGNSTLTSVSSPVLVSGPAGASWGAVAAGSKHSLAIRSTGVLYAWGDNLNGGQLGTASLTSVSSPVLVSAPAGVSFSAISAGVFHNLSVTTLGELYTWGLGTSGQLGDSTVVSKSSPIKIGTSSWSAVSAGWSHNLGVTSQGNLFAWGLGTSGQIGVGSLLSQSAPVAVSIPAVSWVSVAAGHYHSMATTITGILYAWGLNVYGQLGNLSSTTKNSPVLVSTPVVTSWTSIAAGDGISISITSGSQLYGWGSNSNYQVGYPPSNGGNISSPVLVYTLGPSLSWTAISAGFTHTLAISTIGVLYAWGDGGSGQLGNNSLVNAIYPTPVSGPASTSWNAVAAGQVYSLAITTAGILYGWGYNTNYNLGTITNTQVSSPVLVSSPAGLSWSVVSAGVSTSFAITTQGILYSWGVSHLGELGQLGNTSASSPSLVSGPASTSWAAVSAGSNSWNTYAITSTGILYAWGDNGNGQLGINTIATISVSSPVLVSGPAGASWSVVSQGSNYGLAIATTGVLYGWGNNSSGNAGLWGVMSPVQVGLSSWNAIAAGDQHSIGVTVAGLLYAWGKNTAGQLGNNDSTLATQTSPVLVSQPYNPTWSRVATGNSHLLAIRSDGSLWAWGLNTSGQLGNNSTTSSSSPVQVTFPSGASWSIIAAGSAFSLGITTVGALYGWGLNTSGQVGIGSLTNKSSPVLVTGPAAGTSWTAITAGQVHAAGITTIGKLYAWGLNNQLQIGDTTGINKSSPVAVASALSFTIVSSHNQSNTNYAITTLGILYAWGQGSSGQIGDNTLLSKNSPVLVAGPAGVSWKAVSAGDLHGLAIATTGVLYSWGSNSSGQLGTNNITSKSSPVLVSGPVGTSWSIVAGGLTYSLATTITGVLYGWGLNTSGQLGNNAATTLSSPVVIAGPTVRSWTAVAGSATWSAGITSDGSLWGWGVATTYGQTGQGASSISYPGLVAGPYISSATAVSWTAVAAGASFSLAIDTVGVLYGWGYNAFNQLPVSGNLNNLSYPVRATVSAGTSWTTVAAGACFGMAITSTGALYGWGNNSAGQVGINNSLNAISPVLVSGPAGTSWTAVAAGDSHALGVTSGFLLYAWGYNFQGQLGTANTTNYSSPVAVVKPDVPTIFSWSQIKSNAGGSSNSAGHALGIRSDGTLWAWGANGSGQLGIATLTGVSSPVLVSSLAGVSWNVVAVGDFHSLGITTTGLLYGWGLNTSGQVGINSVTTVSSPVLVASPSVSWSTVDAGSSHSLAITTTGILYGWGLNNAGQVGNNLILTVSSPVLVSGPAGTSWTKVAAGGSHSLGITTTGVLYGWGLNLSGQVGISSQVSKSSPVLVSGVAGTSWNAVAAGNAHSLGITSLGVLYAWGLNNAGQLGNNSAVSTSSRVLVAGPAGTSWTAIAAGMSHSIGITTTGVLYTWGYNFQGELGILTAGFTAVSSPVLTSGPAGVSWTSVAAGTENSFAISTIGSLYAWGWNNQGQIGDFTAVSKSSPVVVYAARPLSWKAASAGVSFSMGISLANTLYTWGQNSKGQLGTNNLTSVSSPVLVSSPSGITWGNIALGPMTTHILGITR